MWAVETGLGFYSLLSVIAAFNVGYYGILPFFLLFTSAFLTVGLRTTLNFAKDA